MILLVTSAVPGEGKSTMSIRLAEHFASLGKRVLLIEADLKCPVMAGRCGIKTEVGLTHYLTGTKNGYYADLSFSNIVYASSRKKLFLIPAGAILMHTERYLAGLRFRSLLEKMRAEYDVILIDTAPYGLFQDAAIIAPMCDGAIYVTGKRHSSISFLRVQKPDCPVAGMILNMWEGS